MTYSSTDGQPGSSYHWLGDEKKTGEGTMTTSAINGTEIDIDVDIQKPWNKQAKSRLSAKDTAGMTLATWSFAIHTAYPFNAMNMFVDMDKIMGSDFENGLKNMKEYLEQKNPPAAPKPASPIIEVKEVDFPAHTYQGFRKVMSMDAMMPFFKESYSKLGKGLGKKIAGTAAGLYYTWDTVTHSSDMAAVFPVTDTATKIKDAVVLQVPAGKALMAVQRGGYFTMPIYHNAIMQQMAAKGYQPGLVIEEYVTGPYDEQDSTMWMTNIYYLIK
jgi:effector-binding domain-containing protein